MEQEEGNYTNQVVNFMNTKIRDVEEKQKVLKDRLLLIGQNLIEIKEDNEQKILEIKKSIEEMKQNIYKMKNFLETISGEFSRFAKKEDLEILSRQAKMFQPLEFVRKSDLNK